MDIHSSSLLGKHFEGWTGAIHDLSTILLLYTRLTNTDLVLKQNYFCCSQRYFIYDADTILLNTQGKHIQVLLPTQILQILTLI